MSVADAYSSGAGLSGAWSGTRAAVWCGAPRS